MLIPSIDVMGGKIVQLVQGRDKALEFDNFEQWVERFAKFPRVQLIDLDAAMGNGDNAALVARFSKQLPCQVGGGVRSIESARKMLDLGARRVILGSALVREGKVNLAFAEEIARAVGAERLIFAVDSKGGKVAVRGWRETTDLTALEMMRALSQWCGAFLYTHIDTEGLMQGVPMDIVRELRAATANQLIAAGGISSHAEIQHLDRMGVDAVVGMAVYTGVMSLSECDIKGGQ